MAWTSDVNELQQVTSASTPPLFGDGLDDLLTLDQIRAITKRSTNAIYMQMGAGTFPRPIKIGGSNRWLRTEIVDYLLKLVRERNAKESAKK
jgi:predicted DNA-binding transcriptional regulator AlpA